MIWDEETIKLKNKQYILKSSAVLMQPTVSFSIHEISIIIPLDNSFVCFVSVMWSRSTKCIWRPCAPHYLINLKLVRKVFSPIGGQQALFKLRTIPVAIWKWGAYQAFFQIGWPVLNSAAGCGKLEIKDLQTHPPCLLSSFPAQIIVWMALALPVFCIFPALCLYA